MSDSVSGLILFSEVADLAAFDSNTRASSSSLKCCDVAIQMLVEFKTMKKKGLLAAHLEKTFFIPKKKRSNLSISLSISKRRTDLLAFCIPKKKRSNLVSQMMMKRKRSGEQDDQIPRLKRRRAITGDDLGQEMKNMISSHVPLWSFQRKSPLRFSLIKLHLSAARTTAVS
ncbi:uncharacterized protein LOC121050414 [Rosa chinensis]|uniref:uncharacterized protein LOC121050414 n=1 Tax=Rosa chinensis TaxID=74649 RepID=UPI001AD90423|nr:uncharacterized protein LOC121050414 [Rosa chinensis]